MSYARIEPYKQCAVCHRIYRTRAEWLQQPLPHRSGRQFQVHDQRGEDPEVLQFRDCDCGNTMTVDITNLCILAPT